MNSTMNRIPRRGRSKRRGAVLVWVAVSMLMFIGFLGLSIDFGYLYLSAHQLQSAADAAAHGAARIVKTADEETVRLEAKLVAEQNSVAGNPLLLDDADIIIGHFDKETAVFTPGLENRNAVRVNARRTANSPSGMIPFFFGSIFKVEGANVERTATAIVTGAKGVGLLALAETGCGITMTGSSSIVVNDGAIQINSQTGGTGQHSGCGLCTVGNAHTIEADIIYTDGSEVCSNNYDGPVDKDGPFEDPLGCPPEGCPVDGPIYCCLPAPPLGPTHIVPPGDPITLQPGHYPEGLHVQNRTVNLEPGIYVFGGSGLSVHAGGELNGHGVSIYLPGPPNATSQNPAPGSSLRITSNAVVNLSPPNASVHSYDGADQYHHVVVYQGRNNNAQSTLWAGGGVEISGLMYMPANNLVLGGNPGGNGANIIIAHSYTLTGTANISVEYDGSFASPDDRVYLVE